MDRVPRQPVFGVGVRGREALGELEGIDEGGGDGFEVAEEGEAREGGGGVGVQGGRGGRGCPG